MIDGSAIWAQALARAGCRVTIVLKAPVRTGRLVDPLTAIDGVTVHRPDRDAPMTVDQAAEELTALDQAEPFGIVVVRGMRLVLRLTGTPLAGRLWTYLTDVPQSLADLTGRTRGQLAAIVRASRLLLCQTEELRCHLEEAVSGAVGKCFLFPPVVVLPHGTRECSAGPGGDPPEPPGKRKGGRPCGWCIRGNLRRFGIHWR